MSASGDDNTNLGDPRRTFLGRRAECERLVTLLEQDGGVATILGPPGVGKTMLSRRVARRLHERHFRDADGTWFCRLHDCETRVDVIDRLSSVLPAPRETSGDVDERIATLRAWLEDRSILIVLDNAEHIRKRVRSLGSRLLDASDALRLLITSRQPLELDHPQARTVFLDPLQTDEAAELYRERARDRSAAAVDLTSEDVDRLVEHLDAIPLAIELAAAQLPALGPAGVLERLDQPFELLQVESSETDSFESPLREAIAGSWSLLNDWQQSSLLQCAVFSGGFSVGDAESVLSLSDVEGAPPIPQAINSLARHSLLHVSDHLPETRSFALFESVAEFARQKLRQTDARELRHRHLDHLVDRAAELVRQRREAGRVEVQQSFDARYREMREAIAFGREHAPLQAGRLSVSLAQLASAFSPSRDIADLLERARSALDRLDDDRADVRILRARLRAAASYRWYYSQAPIDEQVGRNYERALDMIEPGDSPAVFGRIQMQHGAFLTAAGESDRAMSVLEESLEHLRGEGWPIDVAEALVPFAYVAYLEDQPERARRLLAEARQLADEHDLIRAKLRASRFTAGLEASLGRLHIAEEHARDAADHAREIGADALMMISLRSLGRYRLALGRLEASREVLLEGIERAEDTGLTARLGDIYSDLGMIHLLGGDVDAARQRLQRATQYHRRRRIPVREVESLCRSAAVAYLDGRMAEGDARLESARELVSRTDRPRARLQLEVMARFRDLGEAARAFENDEVSRGTDLVASAADLEADENRDGPALDETVDEQTQVASQLLSLAVEAVEEAYTDATPPVDPSEALQVARNAWWFQKPEGERVDLSRRTATRRLLWKLARRRDEKPGAETDVFELIEAGWPDEEILPESGKARVYNAIGTLRDLGLEGILLTGEDGYLLDPDVPVVIVDE